MNVQCIAYLMHAGSTVLMCLICFYIQQSSTDIWHAVCAAVKSACSLAGVAPEEVAGLGFAATCSLGLF